MNSNPNFRATDPDQNLPGHLEHIPGGLHGRIVAGQIDRAPSVKQTVPEN